MPCARAALADRGILVAPQLEPILPGHRQARREHPVSYTRGYGRNPRRSTSRLARSQSTRRGIQNRGIPSSKQSSRKWARSDAVRPWAESQQINGASRTACCPSCTSVDVHTALRRTNWRGAQDRATTSDAHPPRGTLPRAEPTAASIEPSRLPLCRAVRPRCTPAAPVWLTVLSAFLKCPCPAGEGKQPSPNLAAIARGRNALFRSLTFTRVSSRRSRQNVMQMAFTSASLHNGRARHRLCFTWTRQG